MFVASKRPQPPSQDLLAGSSLGKGPLFGVYLGGALLTYFRIIFIIVCIAFGDCFNVPILAPLHLKNLIMRELSKVAARLMVFSGCH